jgi:hypothetical protein
VPLEVRVSELGESVADATVGRWRGRPILPATGVMPSTNGSSSVVSLRFPPVNVTASGTPAVSTSKWCSELVRARSTGEGTLSPPRRGADVA